ncbi:MAG: Fic family protein [Candidatus Nanoarchaeia archaeon]
MVFDNALLNDRFYEIKPFTYSTRAKSQIIESQRKLYSQNRISLFEIPHLCPEFLREFVYHNHGLEGIELNYDDIDTAIKGVKKKQMIEAKNSLKVHKFVFGNNFKFSLDDIVEAHTILMDGIIQYSDDDIIPQLGIRESDIYLGSHQFQGYSPELIEKGVNDLTSWIRENEFEARGEFRDREVERVLHLGINFYFNFERVHPFNDGNGRLGRILLLRLLSQTRYFPFYFSQNKRSVHMGVFDRTIRGGNRKTFSDFFIKEYRDCITQFE